VGYPNIGTNAWQGIFVPMGTPAPVIQRLHASLQKLLARPDVKESLAKMMIEAQTSASPAEFTQFVEAENAKWSKVASEMNVRAEE
jgi:tripartite-type tricarboxylate transporter receptor subunit TctC